MLPNRLKLHRTVRSTSTPAATVSCHTMLTAVLTLQVQMYLSIVLHRITPVPTEMRKADLA